LFWFPLNSRHSRNSRITERRVGPRITQMCANFSALPSNGIHINSNEGITRGESIARVNSLIGQKFENPTSPPTHHTTQVMPAAVRDMLPSISQSYGFRLFFGRKAHSRTINVPTSSFGTPDRRLETRNLLTAQVTVSPHHMGYTFRGWLRFGALRRRAERAVAMPRSGARCRPFISASLSGKLPRGFRHTRCR
jgi:hypothetical protein